MELLVFGIYSQVTVGVTDDVLGRYDTAEHRTVERSRSFIGERDSGFYVRYVRKSKVSPRISAPDTSLCV